MRDLNEENQDKWDEAYNRGGNITFYPNEEVVRFINRFVRKRRGISEFEDVIDLGDRTWDSFRSLDLGCGIGRHTRIMEEFGLNPYGIDLSETAIAYGKKWFNEIGMKSIPARLQVGSVAELPFKEGYFDICISESVLDSMPREIAKKGVGEVWRVLRSNGLFFLSLIMDDARKDEDVIVDFGYEKDTIQSYFTLKGIQEFLSEYFDIVDIKIVATEDVFTEGMGISRFNENLVTRSEQGNMITTSKRAYIVARKQV